MPSEPTTPSKNPADATRTHLDPLLAPRSIALLGASMREQSFGRAMLEMATGSGYQGAIYPVNRKYDKGFGRSFYPRLAAVPEPVEHVVMAVAAERVEAALVEAVEHGAKAVTIFAACQNATLQDRIAAIARETGLLLCGPNCMGFHNLGLGLRVSPFPAPIDLVPGGIAAVLQSGSVMGALAHNDRRLHFNFLVSTGSELILTAADYLHWALDQSTTRVIGLFLEAVRDPSEYLEALRKAQDRDLPVVVLKVGRTAVSKRMANSHTGAIVGDHGVFEAVSREHGVHLVETLDEMAATLLVFGQGRRPATGGVAAIHDSGGERELLVDLAGDLALPLARFSARTRDRIGTVLKAGLAAENPLDAWQSGKHAQATFLEATKAMMEDDDVAVGLYVLDWRDEYYLHEMHEAVLIEAARATSKPLLAATNYALTRNEILACRLADQSVPLLEGTRESLQAVKHLLAHRDRQRRPAPAMVEHPDAERIRRELEARPEVGEVSAFALLAAYGVAAAACLQAGDKNEALEAAARLGYPVALKTAEPGLVHKRDVQGVKLGLRTDSEVAAAYQDMASRLGPRVLVSEMVAGAAEWAVGVLNDEDFGPAIMIGPGGTLVELLDERVVLIAPVTPAAVAAELRKLRAGKLHEGYRGQSPLAIDALCESAANISRLAVDLRDQIAQMEVNPIIVSRTAATAVDVLIEKRRR